MSESNVKGIVIASTHQGCYYTTPLPPTTTALRLKTHPTVMPMVPDGFFFKGGAGTGVGTLTGFGWAGVGDEDGPGMGVGNFGVGVGTTGEGAGGQQSLAQQNAASNRLLL
jgi:hypothetical protein